MKQVLFLLFVLISTFSVAQNWKLLDPNKTYFYKHIDSLYITNTIKTDSTVNSVSDSIFYIHTTIKVCDTCTNVPPEAAGGVLYHAHYPEIFGYTPYYNVSDNAYQFANGIIKHQSEISDSWVFNSTLLVNAIVTDKYETTILGVTDSIKVIELSTLDTIIISKNHGVVRYPDFENSGKYFLLAGYHMGQNSYGEYLPNMWRIYDFEAGDVFCFSHRYNWIDLDQCEQGDIYKISVLSDNSTLTGRYYDINIIQMHYEECVWGGNYSYYLDNYQTYLGISNDYAFYENTYSGILPVYDDFSLMYPDDFYPMLYSSYQVDESYLLDGIYRHFITHRVENGLYIKYLITTETYSDSLFFIPDYISFDSQLEFAENLGRTYRNIHIFEQVWEDELDGWITDGDTVGTIYQFVEVPDFKDINYQIFPNPTSDLIYIPENCQAISLYTTAGQMVLYKEDPGNKISVGNLPKGIYIVHFVDLNGHQLTSRLILQ